MAHVCFRRFWPNDPPRKEQRKGRFSRSRHCPSCATMSQFLDSVMACTVTPSMSKFHPIFLPCELRAGALDITARCADRQNDRYTDRRTDRMTDTQTDGRGRILLFSYTSNKIRKSRPGIFCVPNFHFEYLFVC